MSKLFVIDWQKDGLLVARGAGRSGRVALDQVSFQPIGENEDGRKVTAEEALHKAVAELGYKGEVVVVASREAVEMRTISVPKMDADELPEVIRFQAQRQMTSMTDSWAIDYVMLPPIAGQEMQTALVAGMSPAHLADIERTCHSAGLTVRNICMRPIEMIRYAAQSGKLDMTGPTMVVCVSESTAELLILREGQCVQVRGTRLPHELDQAANSLKGDIRRSLMAVSSHFGGQALTDILLLSTPAVADQLEAVIAEATGASVTHLDPATILPASASERTDLKQATHRLAAVAGAVTFETADKKSYLDFKNPKRRPPKKSNKGRYLLYGGAATALLLCGLGWVYMTGVRLDQEAADLRAQIAEKADSVKLATNKVEEWRQVEAFLNTAPNWLDELAYLSERMPGSDKVILEAPTLQVLPTGESQIKFKVRADKADTITSFEESVRDEKHKTQGSSPTELPRASDGYKWSVDEVITIKDRGWKVFGKPVSTKTSSNSVTAKTNAAQADASQVQAKEPDASDSKTEIEPEQATAQEDDDAVGSSTSEPESKVTEATTPLEAAQTDAPATDANQTDKSGEGEQAVGTTIQPAQPTPPANE